jgi:DNA-binding transcriptional LysR family regulator
MELYQLRGFAAVAEVEHLTRAADRLHVSQPALSAQIKGLEDELGIPLFERGAGGMSLTPAGRRLLPEAQAVIAAAQSLRNAAQTLKGAVSGHARVGTLSDPEFVRLPRLLAAAVARYPLLEIMLRHEVSGAAFDKVKNGELDASFYYGSRTHSAVASIALRTFAYCIVAPAGWRERIVGANFHDIAVMPWIMTPPNSSHRALARDLFDQHGMEPTTLVEADHEAVISSLVVGGLGLALMREDLAQAMAAAGEVCIWEGTRLATTLQFLCLRERTSEPVIQALLDIVHDVWPQAAIPRAA